MGANVTSGIEVEGFSYYDLDPPPRIPSIPPGTWLRPAVSGGVSNNQMTNFTGSQTVWVPYEAPCSFFCGTVRVRIQENREISLAAAPAMIRYDLDPDEYPTLAVDTARAVQWGAVTTTVSIEGTLTLPTPVLVSEGYFYLGITVPASTSGYSVEYGAGLGHSNASQVPLTGGRTNQFYSGSAGTSLTRYAPYLLLGVNQLD